MSATASSWFPPSTQLQHSCSSWDYPGEILRQNISVYFECEMFRASSYSELNHSIHLVLLLFLFNTARVS